MIIIRDMPLDCVSKLDQYFGHFWRNGDLISSDQLPGCVNVMLGNDTVIRAMPSCNYIILKYYGKIQRIEVESFSEVVIA